MSILDSWLRANCGFSEKYKSNNRRKNSKQIDLILFVSSFYYSRDFKNGFLSIFFPGNFSVKINFIWILGWVSGNQGLIKVQAIFCFARKNHFCNLWTIVNQITLRLGIYCHQIISYHQIFRANYFTIVLTHKGKKSEEKNTVLNEKEYHFLYHL